MSVDKIVNKTDIPVNLQKFANWNEVQYKTPVFNTASCASFCTGGACTTAYKNISYFGNLKVNDYQRN